MKNLVSVLKELEARAPAFGENKEIRQTLRALAKLKIADAESVIRVHETLLLLRAYPPSARVLRQVEGILKTFSQRVAQLRAADVDLSPLDDPEVSGIAGGSVTSNFSYALVRWLATRYPNQLAIDWEWFEEDDRFGATMPRFLPLLEEDAMVEAHVPYREWLRAARGRKNEVVWLIERFEEWHGRPARESPGEPPILDKTTAEAYDSLKLHVTWRYDTKASRTGMKLPTRRIFYHKQPLISRREISLVAELSSSPIPVERLSPIMARKVIEMARETSAVRYRELHGFTYSDPRRVIKADLGRGTEAHVIGVPTKHRLPLRAYHAALILKNGVPVAYFEGLSLFERMESGFNLYYTFRDGETAWLYARILRLMRQLLGVTVFSIDPYQVGHENEEGIESGAFWFYRKLGFRPVRPQLLKLTVAEEDKIASRAGYRTPARQLRKLAAGHMLFAMPDSQVNAQHCEWDHFEVRNIGLALQRRMARDFKGDAQEMRAECTAFVDRVLNLKIKTWTSAERCALENLTLVLATIPGIERWNTEEKQRAAMIVRAKAGGDEAVYLRLMQRHSLLREELIRIGCAKQK
jgi:hypothetical protein